MQKEKKEKVRENMKLKAKKKESKRLKRTHTQLRGYGGPHRPGNHNLQCCMAGAIYSYLQGVDQICRVKVLQ